MKIFLYIFLFFVVSTLPVLGQDTLVIDSYHFLIKMPQHVKNKLADSSVSSDFAQWAEKLGEKGYVWNEDTMDAIFDYAVFVRDYDITNAKKKFAKKFKVKK